jgi:hypothetical protein
MSDWSELPLQPPRLPASFGFSGAPRIFCRTFNGSAAPSGAFVVTDCRRAEPLDGLEVPGKDDVDTFEASDKEEDRGLKPGRVWTANGAR